jgi:hypothetical protein
MSNRVDAGRLTPGWPSVARIVLSTSALSCSYRLFWAGAAAAAGRAPSAVLTMRAPTIAVPERIAAVRRPRVRAGFVLPGIFMRAPERY